MSHLLLGLFATLVSLSPSFSPKDLEGRWVQAAVINDVTVYTPANIIDKPGPYIEFVGENTLRVRQNAGWCGTPPISYTTYEGSFSITSGNKLHLEHKFWGGQSSKHYEIVEATADTLKLRFIARD